MVTAHELFTHAAPASRAGKVFQFPLARFIVAALFIAPYLLLHNTIIADFIVGFEGTRLIYANTIDRIVSFVALLLLYAAFVRIIERRPVREVSPRGAPAELGAGILIALGLIGIMALILSATRCYRIEETGPAIVLLNAFFLFGFGAFMQELFFSVMLFRLVEEWLGTAAGIVIIAATFALMHLINSNATVWSTVALMLGELLLVGAFIYTRRLWLVWGIHWGWNFFQDGVLGMPNSGITSLPSWIKAAITGPSWLTGGTQGIEASVIALMLTLLVAAIVLKRAIGAGQTVRPMWKRESEVTARQ